MGDGERTEVSEKLLQILSMLFWPLVLSILSRSSHS